MRESPTLVAAIAVPVLLLLIAGGVAFWRSIPPTPDPNSLPSSVLEPPSPEFAEAVAEGRSIARILTAEEKLPGLSLAVGIDGVVVWAEGFGWADVENEVPVTPATTFRIGGVTQTLTAAAVGLLLDRDNLDLDAPVQRYVPGFPEKQWPVTTRQLMAHTSGIRAHRGEGGLFQGNSCSSDDERLALFAAEPLRSQPGTVHTYSTSGWTLVGAIIAGVAQEPYLDFLHREIFAPLGMGSTVPDRAGEIETGSAHFYYPRLALNPRYGLQDAPSVDLSCYLPAVGFLSTPTDLVRFGSAMMGDELLDPATVAELQTPVPPNAGETKGQALGWSESRLPLGSGRPTTRIVGQGLGVPVARKPLSATTNGGEVAGGTTTLVTVPEHRLVIAVTSNVSGAENVSALSLRLAEIFSQLLDSR